MRKLVAIRRLLNVNRQKKMTYSYGTTPTTLTPTSGSWSSETWTLNTSLTTSTHVYYDATAGAPTHHTPARIAIDYSAGSTASTQVWETATGTNYNGSTLSPYLTITSTGGSGDSTAVYSGPGGSPANVVTFTKVFIDVSSSGGGAGTNALASGSLSYDFITETITWEILAVSPSSGSNDVYSVGNNHGASIGPLSHTNGQTSSADITSNQALTGTWILYHVKNPGNVNIVTRQLDQLIIGAGNNNNNSGNNNNNSAAKRKVSCNFW